MPEALKLLAFFCNVILAFALVAGLGLKILWG